MWNCDLLLLSYFVCSKKMSISFFPSPANMKERDEIVPEGGGRVCRINCLLANLWKDELPSLICKIRHFLPGTNVIGFPLLNDSWLCLVFRKKVTRNSVFQDIPIFFFFLHAAFGVKLGCLGVIQLSPSGICSMILDMWGQVLITVNQKSEKNQVKSWEWKRGFGAVNVSK